MLTHTNVDGFKIIHQQSLLAATADIFGTVFEESCKLASNISSLIQNFILGWKVLGKNGNPEMLRSKYEYL